ncbi:uncharacterized protein LOC125942958 [Dermacentor silvarum]|uniref:uncharacterized protein LOC125942958 n=1 Tax=Dermacentor silvarum TaxID=543639 RepID=UPI0021010192|nr:uncharacterized protein LOC125942958 [Dermacentor silvarum]
MSGSTIAANAPHLPDDEIEEEASGRDVVPDNAGAERTVYDILTGRQLTVSSKSNPRIDRELMAKVEKSWKYYQRARLQLPIFARSSEKPRLPGAEIAASMIGLVVECGAVAPPDYNLGVLAGHRQVHPRDKETCVLTMLKCINPESNSNRDRVVTPSSCLCRIHVREDIVSAINRNHVVVICGETGSGKTTQAGQFIFEDYIRGGQGSRCNIVVTQPRRIAAISMAKQAARERHEELSDTVGFHVRLTKQLLTSRGGKLFCTGGMQLRHWQQNVELQGLSHVIVDEAHEHDVCTNFLLVLLREVLSMHRTFKVGFSSFL